MNLPYSPVLLGSLSAGLLSLVVGTALFLLCRAARTGRWVSIALGSLGSAACGASLLFFASAAQPTSVEIAIRNPAPNTVVSGRRLEVSGEVTPTTARVAVLVKPERDAYWWVQPAVSMDVDGGTWTVDVFLGTEETGSDQNYQVVAVSSADPLVGDLLSGRYLREGMKLRAMPVLHQSPARTVRREDQ